MELWTALFLGFAGSFHCVGMCGPIALSIPGRDSGIGALSLNALIYNSGRILTYALMGLMFGFLGREITLSGFQSIFSIILGSGILITILSSRYLRRTRKPGWYRAFVSSVTRTYARLMKKESVPALFGMGFLNGLLPCAFVYTGLAAAVLTSSPYHSMAYMALFGLGTVPALFSVYLAPSFISMDLRTSIRKYLPYLALGLGVFLIIRGVALQDLQLPVTLMEGMDPFCVFPGTAN